MAYWLCQLFGWGLNIFGQTVSGMSPENAAPTLHIVLEVVSLNLVALLLTHLLRDYMRRHRWQTLKIAALLPRVLVASVLLGFPLALTMGFFSIALLWSGGPEEQQAAGELAGEGAVWLLQAELLLRTLNWSAIFALWMVMYFSITSVRDRARAELRQSELARALQVAELRLLKSQLNPHFLFNSSEQRACADCRRSDGRAEGSDAAGADVALHAHRGPGRSRLAGTRAGDRRRLSRARIAAARRASAHRAGDCPSTPASRTFQ